MPAGGARDMSVVVHSLHSLPTYRPAHLTGHRSAVKAVFFDVGESSTTYTDLAPILTSPPY